jgi:hypothetical protein
VNGIEPDPEPKGIEEFPMLSGPEETWDLADPPTFSAWAIAKAPAPATPRI